MKHSPNPEKKEPQEKRFECNGFLEEWVTHVTGEFQHIRNSIVEGRGDESQLIADVITCTNDNLKRTARDLVKIKDYKLKAKYFQVCDLQGFFLKKGGFKVSDVPAIKQLVCRESCEGSGHDQEPTTEEVLNALIEPDD